MSGRPCANTHTRKAVTQIADIRQRSLQYSEIEGFLLCVLGHRQLFV